LFPTPKTRLLELLSSKPFKAKLEEPALAADKTSGQKTEQLPTYNAYSADGDVTAELVFVNHGVPADYEELQRRGIDVKGKIVIAKYGGSWRGIKPKVAQNMALLVVLFILIRQMMVMEWAIHTRKVVIRPKKVCSVAL
jgi:N-acetylated-alpha-linked acidic dipeptidase